MTRAEKLTYFGDHHLGEWVSMRGRVFNELSDAQTMWCCCGKLASSLHENSCAKFRRKVEDETLKRLSYLLPKQ